MFASNPFAQLTEALPPLAMQAYVVLMALLVVAGTLADLLHKGSARFYLQQRERAEAAATRRLAGGERAALVAATLVTEVLRAGEFCRRERQIAHLLTAYGFVFHLVASVALVFAYPAEPRPPLPWPLLWHLGALMVLAGGGWYFFLLRVDVAHEGHSPFRLVQADLFIVTLLASALFALAWSALQDTAAAWPAFALYLMAATLLFGSVPWSKFAHMFYKPMVAYRRRVEEASGASSLPAASAEGGARCPPTHT